MRKLKIRRLLGGKERISNYGCEQCINSDVQLDPKDCHAQGCLLYRLQVWRIEYELNKCNASDEVFHIIEKLIEYVNTYHAKLVEINAMSRP